jgi:hypothetical protein
MSRGKAMTTMTKRMKTMKTHRVRSLLADSAQPLERRKQLLMHLCLDESEEAVEALHAVLASAAAEASESLYAEKIQELEERRRQMEEGPLRQATFLRLLEAPGSVRRANVLMEDGSTAYVCVPEEELATSLRCGDTVLLEAQRHALLFRDGGAPPGGRGSSLRAAAAREPRRSEPARRRAPRVSRRRPAERDARVP